jgi:parvulin-like peptidyl-prolyl isomerase
VDEMRDSSAPMVREVPSQSNLRLIVLSGLASLCVTLSCLTTYCAAAEEDAHTDGTRVVVATVGSISIYKSEVDKRVTKVLRGREAGTEAMHELRAKAVEQLVKRQLILLYLANKKLGAIQAEVALAETRIVAELKQQGLTLNEFLAKSKTSQSEFQRGLAWQIGWPKYLEKYSTAENLERFFQRQPQEFDGSRYHVAHIIWKVKSDDPQIVADVAAKATKVRQAILAGDISFTDAAKQNSQSPTANNGGDIGWILRHEPMPESFSKSAFQLKEGQVSSPVASAVGIHLIKCIKIEKGKKTWQQSRAKITSAATQFLFDWVAKQQLAETKVQYTGESSYYDELGKRIDP